MNLRPTLPSDFRLPLLPDLRLRLFSNVRRPLPSDVRLTLRPEFRVALLSICLAAGGRTGEALAQTTVFSENFDGAVVPEAPPGWVFDAAWETSSSSPAGDSGAVNLMHRGSVSGAAQTPLMDLGGAAFAQLSYLARRTESYNFENLQVTASTDGGETFPVVVLAPGSAVPTSTSSYAGISTTLPAAVLGASNVVFRFEGLGRSSSSSNLRIDEVLVTAIPAGAHEPGGTIGFSTLSTFLSEGDAHARAAVRLAYEAVSPLQGLQFRLLWVGDSLQVTGLRRGAAVTSTDDWTLSYEAGAGFIDILLLGASGAALPAGDYDPLIEIDLSVPVAEAPRQTMLYLQNPVGAQATPTGADPRLLPEGYGHRLSDAPATAIFAASDSLLDLVDVTIGETSTSALSISNTGGSADLIISEVRTTDPLFAVAPVKAVIPPDSTRRFEVTFAPTFTQFGRRRAALVFAHNGEGDSTMISITGKGRGGRGDAEGDGTVDGVDVVHAIDFVLARLIPGPAETAAADLFPFPEGDGALDVRDLTVLIQAIVRGQWPDEVHLPPEGDGVGKLGAGAAHLFFSKDGTDAATVELSHEEPIRAFQLALPASADDSLHIRTDDEEAYTLTTGQTSETLRLLAFRQDGGAIGPGTRRIRITGRVGAPTFVTVVGLHRERLPVSQSIVTHSFDTPQAPRLRLQPFPNPFRIGADVVRIGAMDARAEVVVYDLLGREVARIEGLKGEWDGRTAAGGLVSPGIYMVRVQSDDGNETTTIVATR